MKKTIMAQFLLFSATVEAHGISSGIISLFFVFFIFLCFIILDLIKNIYKKTKRANNKSLVFGILIVGNLIGVGLILFLAKEFSYLFYPDINILIYLSFSFVCYGFLRLLLNFIVKDKIKPETLIKKSNTKIISYYIILSILFIMLGFLIIDFSIN